MISYPTPDDMVISRREPISPEISFYTQVRFKFWKMAEGGEGVPELCPTLSPPRIRREIGLGLVSAPGQTSCEGQASLLSKRYLVII